MIHLPFQTRRSHKHIYQQITKFSYHISMKNSIHFLDINKTHTRTYIHIRIHSHIHVISHTLMRAYTFFLSPPFTLNYTYINTTTRIRNLMHTTTCTYTSTRNYANYAHTQSHTHTRTHRQEAYRCTTLPFSVFICVLNLSFYWFAYYFVYYNWFAGESKVVVARERS